MSDGSSQPTFEEIIAQLSPEQRTALLTDERAIEELPWQDRDHIICLGLARRAWPIGQGVRSRLAPLHHDTHRLADELLADKGE